MVWKEGTRFTRYTEEKMVSDKKTPEDIRYTGKILSQDRDEASGGQLTELGGYSFPGRGDVNH